MMMNHLLMGDSLDKAPRNETKDTGVPLLSLSVAFDNRDCFLNLMSPCASRRYTADTEN